MTRTGVLALLIAAYAVTNTHQAYANSIESNPLFLQASRNMQASLQSYPTTDTTQLRSTYNKIFGQFIDSTLPRLSGHITTDKMYYTGKDPVFIDLLMVNTKDKIPFINDNNVAGSQQITISLLDSTGTQVEGVQTLSKAVPSGTGPAHGFSLKLPADISPGSYLIVAQYPYMATATKTIVVQTAPTTSAVVNNDPIPPYTGIFKFFGQTFDGAGTLSGRIQVFLTEQGAPLTERVQFTFSAYKSGQQTAFVTRQVNSEAYAVTYFQLPLNGNSLSNNDVIKIEAKATLTNPAGTPATIAATFVQEITIGASIQSQEINEIDQTTPAIDYSRLSIQFFSESMSDLVPSTPQVVYFRSYFKQTADLPEEPFDLTGASLYAYNPNLYSVDLKLIQSGISTLKGGFGVLKEFVYDNSKIYFLQWKPTGYKPTVFEADPLTNPIKDTIVLEDGTFRIPLIVEGIQTRLSNIEKKVDLATIDSFPAYLLNDFTFEAKAQTLPADAVLNSYSRTFDLGYANGFFFVKINFAADVLVNFPPLLVFNNFPRPADFKNLLLANSNKHIQGLILDSEQPTIVQQPINNNADKLTFLAEGICKQFFIKTLAAMQAIPAINALIPKIRFTLDGNNVIDPTLVANYNKLGTVFRQVANVPQENSKYFGKYGPLAQQVPTPVLETYNTLIDNSALTPPTISFQVQKKVLDNTANLVVLISTNNDFDSSAVYLLQIKQKETVVYEQILNLKKRLYKEKIYVAASSFASTNGGIFQVNLYRTTKDYETYKANIGNQQQCNIMNLDRSYSSLSLSEQGKVDAASDADILKDDIVNALAKLKIDITGTTCVLITPHLVQRFTESIASISIFKKPQNAYRVDITAVTPADGTKFVQGQSVTLTLKLWNMATKSNVIDDSQIHHATIMITEDIATDANSFYKASLPGKVYLENNVDFEKYKQLDPLAQVNQHYTTTTLSGSSDAILDMLLTINNLRNSVFEAKVYSILDKANPADIDQIYKSAIPQTFEKLSQLFGYNFQKDAYNQNSAFTESDIRNYAGAVANANLIKSNIVNLKGADQPYRRSRSSLFDVYSDVTTKILAFDPLNAYNPRYALNLPADYKAFNNKYQAETIYYSNNLKFIRPPGGTDLQVQVTLKLGDLPGNFKISASSYGSKGFGYGEKVITVGSAFKVDFDIPSRIGTGDVANITATITNAHGLVMTVTPSIDVNVAQHITADFQYTDFAKDGNNWVGTSRNTYPFTALQTSRQIPFQIKGGVVGVNDLDVTFTFNAKLSSNGTEQTVTVTKKITIVENALRQQNYGSGEIQTDSYNRDILEQNSVETITVTLPSADLIQTGLGIVTLYPTTRSVQISQVRRVLGDSAFDRSLDQILHKIMILLQFINTNNNAPFNGADIASMKIQASQQILKLVDGIQYFVIPTSLDNTKNSVDNFRKSSQTEGDVILTAYCAYVLSLVKTALITDLTQQAAYQTKIESYVNWIITDKFSNNAFITMNSEFAKNYPDDIVLQAFVIHTLKQITVTGTMVSDLDNALTTALPAIETFADLIVTDQATVSFKYSPYTVAYTILALSANKVTYQTKIDTLCVQINRYIQKYGLVEVPMGQGTNKIRSSTMTIFGGVGVDRTIEVAALASMALTQHTTPANYVKVRTQISNFIKKHNNAGMYGSITSTVVANKAIIENTIQTTTKYKVDVSVGNAVFKTVKVEGDYLPINIVFTAKDLGFTAADAGKQIQFKLGAYGLTLPLTGSNYDLDTDGQIDKTLPLTTGPIDSVIQYQFLYESIDSGIKNNKTSQHGLSFSVSSLNPASSLGQEASLGQTFSYRVHLINQLTERNQGPIYVLIRPPACLSFDAFQLNALQGPGEDKMIQSWESYDETHEYVVYIRGIEAKNNNDNNEITFTVSGKQVSTGTCLSRPYEAGYVNTELLQLIALPTV